jgi:hypothetical protein
VWYDDVTNVTYRRVVMNRTHNGPMIKGRSQGNATVADITFEDIILIDVYLGLTIDCDYETAGTHPPNIGVLAVNVTFKNITGTVVPIPPRYPDQNRQQLAMDDVTDEEENAVGGKAGKDPSMVVDAAGTFICLSKRQCQFELMDVHIKHTDPSNTVPPIWLCNNTVNDAHDISPPLSATCLK